MPRDANTARHFLLALVLPLLLAATSLSATVSAADGVGAWTTLSTSGAPSPRADAAGVWTGTEFLVWGGLGNPGTGAAYDPATNTWRALPTVGAPSPREHATDVWTGSEMLVWGGQGPSWRGDGAAYNPTTNSWRALPAAGAPSPRYNHTAVWTGTAMLVWGGRSGSTDHNDGAAYNPATNSWRALPTAGAPSPRANHAAVWTGNTMLVWGGDAIGRGLLGDGAAYDPSANTWAILPPAGAPSPRVNATAVWTGSSMLLWGGTSSTGQRNDGAAYAPVTHAWTALPVAGAPSPREDATAIWTGTQMLIWGGEFGTIGAPRFLGDGAAYTPPPSPAPHDNRYFAQTGYRVDNTTIWDYFQRRGGVTTFGYPTSRTFTLQGFTVQFFQRRIVQLGPDGHARLLNLLDSGLMPYTRFNGSSFPGVDSALVATAPDPTDQPAVLAWVRGHAPNMVGSSATNFYATLRNTVTAATAFPTGGDTSLLPGFDLEMWGVPTSTATVDPNNHGFVYLRWQRGIMMYDAACTCTQGVLLADYFKAILTGQNLPADLAQESASSPFRGQYDPSAPNWVRNPGLLPDTNLTNAFTPE